MVKATLRSAVLLAALAIGMLALSMPSFAEVQNVKVGGDITVRAFHRENLDLHQEDTGGPAEGDLDDEDDFIEQVTAINVGADLTENVSAFIRVVNERTWDALGAPAPATAGDVDISQAYITLKELFYAPLTLRVGTQPIVWGRGFVLGSNLIPSVFPAGDRNGSIIANEFTDFTAFDAIRATLDLADVAEGMPLGLDVVYIKQREGISSTPDDENLFGANLSARADDMNAELETYYLNKNDKSPGTLAVAGSTDDASVNTWGIRGSIKPDNGLNVFGEIAYQWGTRDVDFDGNAQALLPAGDSQQAWAANFGADLTFADVATSPKIGAEWIFYSGKDVDGASQGWDPIARGYFTTPIRDFQTGGASGFYGTDQLGDTSPATNQHQLSLYSSLSPIEDLVVAPRLSWFVLDAATVQAPGGQNERNRYAGAELDTVVTYNYTDDVQLGLIYGLFMPGDVYQKPNDSTAQEIITSVSVKF